MNNNIEPTSLGWGSEPQPKKSKTWIWIVLAVLVLCLCLAVLGVGLYYFLTIRSSEVSTHAPGGGDFPSAPTFAPLATMAPSADGDTDPAHLPGRGNVSFLVTHSIIPCGTWTRSTRAIQNQECMTGRPWLTCRTQ